MPLPFDCKTITIEHVKDALRRLQQQYNRSGYSTDHVARETMRGLVGDNYYRLSDKEQRSAEGRVRRLLKKEEKETGLIRDVCWKSIKSSWTLVLQEQIDQENAEKEERKKREDKVKHFCAKAGIDPDDVSCYGNNNVGIPYEDFERLMKHYG